MLTLTLIFTTFALVSNCISCVNIPSEYVVPSSILIWSVLSFVFITSVPVPSGFFSTDTSYLFSPDIFATLPFTLIVSILCSSNGWTTLNAVAISPVALSFAVIVAVPISCDTRTPSLTTTTSVLLELHS